MTGNMQTIWVNRALNAIMWLAGVVASAALAGQLPAWLMPWVPLISLAGTAAAKFSKTPSPAIAAAVSPAQVAAGVPVPPPKAAPPVS